MLSIVLWSGIIIGGSAVYIDKEHNDIKIIKLNK